MRGGAVFFAFFLLFTLASVAVPVPLFPGNMIPVWFSLPSSTSTSLFSALFNGLVYGLLVWLVFVMATRRLDESGVAGKDSKKEQNQRNKRRAFRR